MKKILCIVIAMLMIATTLVSCNTTGDPTDTTAADTTAEDTTAADTTTQQQGSEDKPTGEPADIKLMTFNLRSSDKDETRTANVLTILTENQMDVFCFQECDTWMTDLNVNLIARGYKLAQGTKVTLEEPDGAIYYNESVLKHIKSGFWQLMKKGDTVGGPYGPASRHTIYCTYAVLEHIETGKQFVVLNAHLDYGSDPAVRTAQAEKIFEKIDSQLTKYKDLPKILCGDMNVDYNAGKNSENSYYHPTESTFYVLNDGVRFKWAKEFDGVEFIAENMPNFRWYPGEPYTLINNAYRQDYPNDGTAEDYTSGMDKRIIDFVFVTPDGSVTPKTYEVLYRNFAANEGYWRYASDHMPVICEMTIN